MVSRKPLFSVASCLMFILAVCPGAIALEPVGLVTDHMVIQRGQAAPLWGTGQPGHEVTVELAGHSRTAVPGVDGRWQVSLPPMEPGGPHELVIRDDQATLRFTDVLIGDVWICSGQSNMQWPVERANNPRQEIAAGDHPRIRLYQVPRRVAGEPAEEVQGRWHRCTPQTVAGFSAVGYFFGRAIHQATNVPIGLIESDWGGTPAEAWTPRAMLAGDPLYQPILDRFADNVEQYDQLLGAYQAKLRAWERQALVKDPGIADENRKFIKPGFDASAWKTMALPQKIESAGEQIDGAVWFRRTVDIPADWAGDDLMLSLGAIDDFDVTWFNGEQVGQTDESVEDFWRHPRQYRIPGRWVKTGRNVIVVRLFDRYATGGFTGPAEVMQLKPAKGPAEPIDLTGNWRYQLGDHQAQPDQYPPQPHRPLGPDSPRRPSGLYNGMIAPLVPYAIKGVTWYQGESNAGRAYQYRKLFPDMIRSWRRAWGYDMPFLFVQLANFQAPQTDPAEASAWAELREAQTMTLALPNTAMAVAIDVGEADDIHPRDKQTVGLRLALAALGQVYGEGNQTSGPMLSKARFDPNSNRVELKFDHSGTGLMVRGEQLEGFVIADADQQFHWASAKIVPPDTVIVWSEAVARPAAVRYGWANNPKVNLYNRQGLPAVPFRTDNWPGVTVDNR